MLSGTPLNHNYRVLICTYLCVFMSVGKKIMEIFIILQTYVNFVSSIIMAMSTDATCRGLVSPQNGPVTMELTRGK